MLTHTNTNIYELLTEETRNILTQYSLLFVRVIHIGDDKIFEVELVP